MEFRQERGKDSRLKTTVHPAVKEIWIIDTSQTFGTEKISKILLRIAPPVMLAQHRIIRKIAENGSCVIVGRAADYVLKDLDNVVKIFVYAPEEYRVQSVMEVYRDTPEEAARNIRHSDYARGAYYRSISGSEWGERHSYNLMIDSSCGVEKSADCIVRYIMQRESAGAKIK